jgi:GPH family glycoside/pentoside/hexuronide:cation symporter
MDQATIATVKSAPVPFSNKVKYGLGIYAVGLGHISVGALSLFFYTEVMRLTPAQAGLIFFLATISDVLTEVTMGWLVSRTRSRLGHYRPWIIAGSFPFGLFLALLFVKFDLSAESLFVYALATHILFRIAFGMVSMPYTAMIARISTDPDERASIGAVKAVFSAAGALTATYLGLRLVHILGAGDDRLGFLLTGMIFGLACCAALLFCGLFTREHEGVIVNSDEATSPLDALRLIASNPALLTVLGSVLLFFSAYTIMQAGVAYYFKYHLGQPEATSNAFLMIAIAGLTTPPLWAKLVHLTNKRFVWIAGSLCVATALGVLAFIDVASMPLVYAMYFLFGAGNGALVLNYAAITADAIDYGDLRSGRRSEAYSFACLSVSSRLSIAMGGAIAGFSLSLIGFLPGGVEQRPETLASLPLAVCALPAALALGSALLISRFPVTTTVHRNILAGLAARSASHSAAADAI